MCFVKDIYRGAPATQLPPRIEAGISRHDLELCELAVLDTAVVDTRSWAMPRWGCTKDFSGLKC